MFFSLRLVHAALRAATVTILILLAACGGGGGGDRGGRFYVQTADLRDPSVARQWSEVLLAAIRNDFARPTVHARNLFHVSSAMYDAWAVYADTASPYLLGRTVGSYQCDLGKLTPSPFQPG